jgi:hypothetical protein
VAIPGRLIYERVTFLEKLYRLLGWPIQLSVRDIAKGILPTDMYTDLIPATISGF